MSQMNAITRRNFLRFGLGGLGGVATAFASRAVLPRRLAFYPVPSNRSFAIDDTRSLKQRAAAKGLIYGAVTQHQQLMSDVDFATQFTQESSLLIPEWELKWTAGDQNLRPGLGEFDFVAVDEMAEFASTHGLRLRGHTLIWHKSLPSWVSEVITNENAQQLLTSHIRTVVGRYAGQMHSWDVVNEAIASDPRQSKRPDQLRVTPWLEHLGPDYIELAFRTAAEADPDALLVYNEFGLDSGKQKAAAKRTATLNLMKRLKASGTPIHALGIQAHLGTNRGAFAPDQLREFLKAIADLGLKIMITELDVSDQNAPADIDVRDRIIAGVYEDYLSVVLDEPAVIGVITWGLSDRYTYLSEFSPRQDGKPVRPLPLDADLQPKLAWNAIARAFDSAPSR